MRNFVGTDRQIKAKKVLENILLFISCPIWIPFVLLYFIFSYGADIVEYIILDGGNDLIYSLSSWIARKIIK